MDFDSIPYGVDFRDHIRETLKRAKVVVAIIGADWSGGREAAPRRIDDPGDFVRLEIASALESGIPIIPVLVNNTPMPDAKNLPADLEGLAFRNGLALDTGIDFHHHADRLIAGIHKVIDPPAPSSKGTAPPQANATRRKTRLLATAVASLAALAGIAGWYFVIYVPRQPVRHHEIADQPAVSAPSAATPSTATTSTSIAPASVPQRIPAPPPVTTPPPVASTADGSEAGREYTYFGKVGTSDAVFRLRFEEGDRVMGTYSQGGSTYRIEGRHRRTNYCSMNTPVNALPGTSNSRRPILRIAAGKESCAIRHRITASSQYPLGIPLLRRHPLLPL